MKKRKGFVSNSSSTSFLVSREAYENVFELAKAIVINRHRGYGEEESTYYLENSKPANLEIIQQLDKAKEDEVSPNTTVFITSANSDIYVGLWEESYIVETDRNNEYLKYLDGVIKQDLMRDYTEGEWSEEDSRETEVYKYWMKRRLLYIPEYDVQGYHYKDHFDFDSPRCENIPDHHFIARTRIRVKKELLEEMNYAYDDRDKENLDTIIDVCPACFAALRKTRLEVKTHSTEEIINRLSLKKKKMCK